MDRMNEDLLSVSRYAHKLQSDAAVVADMNIVVRRLFSLSYNMPVAEYVCTGNVVACSSLLYHSLETSGINFFVESKRDFERLSAMSLSADRQLIARTNNVTSFLKAAIDNGITTFPIDCVDQIHRLLNLNPDRSLISVFLVVQFESENDWFLTLQKMVILLQQCTLLGVNVSGLSFTAGFLLTKAAISTFFVVAKTLLNVAQDDYNFCISKILFSPEFLNPTDIFIEEWPSLCNAMLQSLFDCKNLSICFDATTYIFTEAFVLWARVKDKQLSVQTDTRLYTVSEGVFSLFEKLLAIQETDIRPSVVACSSSHEIEISIRSKRTKVFDSKICGPSGDLDLDTLVSNCHLPDLDPEEDWLLINFGSVIPSGLNVASPNPLLYIVQQEF